MDEKQLRKKRDKELIELLNELRVVLPGAQVLFAFLLIAPFSAGFASVTRFEKVMYLSALLSTLLATILLIAPGVYHRLRWRERNKERMLRTSNRLAIAGTAVLALGMTSSVLLVTDVLVPRWLAVLLSMTGGLLFALGWFALPLSRPYDRWDERDDDDGDDDDAVVGD